MAAIPTREEFNKQYEAARQQGMGRKEAINYLAQAAVAAQPSESQSGSKPKKSNSAWQPGQKIPTRDEWNAEHGVTTWQPDSWEDDDWSTMEAYERNSAQQPTFDANAALANLQNIAATTSDKKLAKIINRYTKGDTKKDNFWGQTAASFGAGQINELLNQAAYKASMNPKDQNAQAVADAYRQLSEYYNNVNAEALDDQNRKFGWLSKDMAQYAPQFLEQTKAGGLPTAIGAGLGLAAGLVIPTVGEEGATTAAGAAAANAVVKFLSGGLVGPMGGTIAGTKVGSLAGSAKYSYETMRGAAYMSLRDAAAENNLDISDEELVNAANDEAIVSSAIENLDTAMDYFALIPGLGNAMKNLSLEGIKGLKGAIARWGGNMGQEGLEEFTQQIISIANERRTKSGDTDSGILGLIEECGNVVGEMIRNTEEGRMSLQEALEAAKGGAIIGGFMAPAGAVVHNVVTGPVNDAVLNGINNLDPNKERAQQNRNYITESVDAKHARDQIDKYIKGTNALTPEQRKEHRDSWDNISKQFSGRQRGDHLVDADGNEIGTITFHGAGGYLLKIGNNEEVVFASSNDVYGSVDPNSTVYKTLMDGGRFLTDDQYKIAQEQKAQSAEAEMTPEERREAAETLGFEPASEEEAAAERQAQEAAAFQEQRQYEEDQEMARRQTPDEVKDADRTISRESNAIRKELDNANYQLDQLIKAGVAAYEGDAGAYQRDYQELQARVNDLEAELRVTEQKTPKQPEAPTEKSAPVVTEEQKEQPKAEKVEQPAPQPAPAQNNLTSEEQAFVAFPRQKRLDTTIDGNNVIIRKHGSKGNYSYTVAVGKTVIAQGKTVSEAKQNAEAYFAQQNQASEMPSESPQNVPANKGTSNRDNTSKASTEQSGELVAPEQKKAEEQPKAEEKKAEEESADSGKKYTESFGTWRDEYLKNRTKQVALTDEAKALDEKLNKAKSSEWLAIIKEADTATLENLLQNMAKVSKTDGKTGTIAKWIYDELKSRESPRVYEQKEKKAPSEPPKTPEERRAEAKAKAPKLTEEKQKQVDEKQKKEAAEWAKKRKERQSLTDNFMQSLHGTSLDPEDISMSLYEDDQLYNRIAAAGEALGVKRKKGEKYYNYINRVLEEAYGVENAIPMGFGSKASEKSDEYADLDDEEKDPTTFHIDQEYNRANDTVEDDEGKSVRISVSGGVGNLDMPKALAQNIKKNKARLADLDKKIGEFEDDGRAPTKAQLNYRDSLRQQIAEDQEDMKAYQYRNKYAELVGLLSHYADADGTVDIPYVSDKPNPTLGDIIKAIDIAQNTDEFEFDSDIEEQLKKVLGVDDVWDQPANKLLEADENAEEWIPPEVARKNAKNKATSPDPDAERQLKIIKDSADELAARGKIHSTEKGAKYVDDESGLSSKDVPELSKANRDAYDALSQEDKILAEDIKNAIGYIEETNDGVTTIDYDWMALSAIMSNPLNNDYIDIYNSDDIQRIQKVLSAIIPSRNANEVNEYRSERNERGESVIVEAKNGQVDNRTINDLLAGKDFIEKQAKKLANDFKSTYDEDPKRRSSWLNADLVKATDVFEQYKKTHREEYEQARRQGKDAEERFFLDFMKQHRASSFVDQNTGVTYFATNGFGMLHSIIQSDLINKAKTFMDKARTDGEQAKAKWYKKLTELYNKRSATSDPKEVKKINRQIKTAEQRIKDSDAYLYALDNYDIKLSDAMDMVFKDGRKKIKIFEGLSEEAYDQFKNFSVKGLSNGVSEELVQEIFDKIAEDTYAEQIIRDIAPKEGAEYTGGTLSSAEIAKRRNAADEKRIGKAANGRSGAEVSEGTPSGELSGGRTNGGEQTGGRSGQSESVGSGQRGVSNDVAATNDAGAGRQSESASLRKTEGKQSPESIRAERKLKKYKSREERVASWKVQKTASEAIEKNLSSAYNLAKTAVKGLKSRTSAFAKSMQASLRANGLTDHFYAGRVVATQGQRTLEQATLEDRRFNTLGKRAAKVNADISICDAFSSIDNTGKTTVSGGTCVTRFENGKLKSTVYAGDYDQAVHEVQHATFINAAFANYEGPHTNKDMGKAKAEIRPVVDKALRKSFEEAKLGKIYDALKDGLKQAYDENEIVEEIYVELSARAFNGSRNGTYSTWRFGGVYLDEVAQVLREESETFNELISLMESNAKEFARNNAAETDSSGKVTLSSLVEDIEAGMGASNEGEVLSRDDYANVMQTLDEMSRSKEYRAYQGQANTDKQRRQTFYDDMNAPSDVMDDLAQSLEAARPHSNFKTAKDLYDMDKDHKPFERIQKVSEKLKKQNISVYSDQDFDNKFGTGWAMRNAKHSYADMTKLFGEVLDGTKTWNQLYQKALLWKGTSGIGTYFNDRNDRLINALKATAVAEARAYASGNDKSNDVINFRYAAANMAEMLNKRIEKVNDIQTGRQVKLLSQARKYGDEAKQQKKGKIDKAIDQYIRQQISPQNMAKMIDGFNKSEDGAGYALGRDIEKGIADKVINEAKLKSFFKDVRNVKSYRDFANGNTKGTVEINGKQASLVEEAYFAGLVRTLEATTHGHPDWSLLDGLKGLFWTDGRKDKNGNENGQWIDLPMSDDYKDAKNMSVKERAEEQRKMLKDMYDKAMKDIEGNEAAKMYADAVADMFEEGKTMNQKAYTDQFGYAMDMYEKGKYMPTAYKSKSGELDGEWDMMGELHNGLMPGFMSRRVRESGGYLVVRPITQVVDNYIGQTANYTAFSSLADTLNILNDENSVYGSFSKTIAENFGEAYGNWWEKYTRDVNMVKEKDLTGINKTLSEFRNRMMQGALVGSLSVPIKQVSSTFSASGIVDPFAVIRAFRPIIRSSPNKVGAVRNLLFAGRQANTEEAQLLKTGLLDRLRNKGKAFEMVIDATTYMDTRAVANVYLACCYDIEKNSTLGKEGLYKNGKNYKDGLTNAGELLVDSLFSEAVLETQPMFIKQARAEMARSDSEIIKMFSTFRTQQTQNFNRLLTTMNEAKAAKKSGDKLVQMQANKELRETVAGQAMAAASIAGLTILADLVLHKHRKYKDDDDDIDINKVAERWMLNAIEAGAGTAWLGSELSKWLIDQMKGNTGDYASNKEFYGISMGAISSMTSAVNAMSWLYSDMLKGGKHAASNARYVVNYVSTLMGIPAQNAYNIMNMFYQWIADGVGTDVISGYSAGKYEDIMKEWDAIRTDYGNKFYTAYKAGNKAKTQKAIDQMGDKFLTMIKQSSLEQLRNGDADDADVIGALTTYGGMFEDDARDAVKTMHLQIDTGYTSLAGTGEKSVKAAWLKGDLSDEQAANMYVKYSNKDKDAAKETVNGWKMDVASQKKFGYKYDDLPDAYKDGRIKRADYKNALIHIGGLTEEKAERKIANKEFGWKYPGHTYQDINKMYLDGQLSRSEAIKWHLALNDTTEEATDNWIERLDFQKLTGYEANWRSTSDLYDTYSTGEKMGLMNFYKKYKNKFSSAKSFGKIFNTLNNVDKTDWPTYRTKGSRKNPNGYQVSDNQARVITQMNKLIKSGDLSYSMAHTIWTKVYGWQDHDYSAWPNVKKR